MFFWGKFCEKQAGTVLIDIDPSRHICFLFARKRDIREIDVPFCAKVHWAASEIEFWRQMLLINSASDLEIKRRPFSWKRIKLERVDLKNVPETEYKFAGKANYLAIHDLILEDGEIDIEAGAKKRLLDVRGLMTFCPSGRHFQGWGRNKERRNSISVLYFDDDFIESETEAFQNISSSEPLAYFSDESLKSTLLKLHDLADECEPATEIYAETLAMLAAIELDRKLCSRALKPVSQGGKLSNRQIDLIQEYIQSHISRTILLSELADLVGLSRFHLLRAFKRTLGVTPHNYLMQMRIDKAKRLLSTTGAPISFISAECGFGAFAHFSATFHRLTGATPRDFRKSLRADAE